MIERKQNQLEIGKRLKQLRKKNHMTQQELAECLYVSVDSVSGYENGRISIGHDFIEKLCLKFNVSADYFYFGREKCLEEGNSFDVWTSCYMNLNEEERGRAIELMRLAFPRLLEKEQ